MAGRRRAIHQPPRFVASRAGLLRALVVLFSLIAILLVLAAALTLYVRGGGPLPVWASFLRPADRAALERSDPPELVLRTLRLAGYERAVVGSTGGKVVVRIEVPSVATPADVALTWQTALAVVAAAYPDSDVIVVQVFSPDQALLEVTAPAGDVRQAIAADDTKALERATRFRYLSEVGDE